jgi:RNA polymerase sigma-70 factor (ECF subfamily)
VGNVISSSEYISTLAPRESKAGMISRNNPEPAVVAELVAQCQSGDVDAFSGLIEHFEKRVFHFVLRMTRQAQDAEDITQDTFVKVWRNIHRFRIGNTFSTWLFTIARRTALNQLRSLKPTQELADYDQAVNNNPARATEERERSESVWSLAQNLKPQQHEALWLRYGEGFSIGEIAQVMGTNAIRVRVLLHRGRKRMAEILNRRKFKPRDEV